MEKSVQEVSELIRLELALGGTPIYEGRWEVKWMDWGLGVMPTNESIFSTWVAHDTIRFLSRYVRIEYHFTDGDKYKEELKTAGLLKLLKELNDAKRAERRTQAHYGVSG